MKRATVTDSFRMSYRDSNTAIPTYQAKLPLNLKTRRLEAKERYST